MRLVTESEYAEAKAAVEQATSQIKKDPKATDHAYRRLKWYEVTLFHEMVSRHVRPSTASRCNAKILGSVTPIPRIEPYSN